MTLPVTRRRPYVGAFGPAARTGLYRLRIVMRTPDGGDRTYGPALPYEGCQALLHHLSANPWDGLPVIRARIEGPVNPAIDGD